MIKLYNEALKTENASVPASLHLATLEACLQHIFFRTLTIFTATIEYHNSL